MKRRFTLATVLVLAVLIGLIAVTATQGGSDDPLVSLSYLTNVFKPQVMAELDQKLTAADRAALAEIEAKLQAAGGGSGQTGGTGQTGGASVSAATYVVVDVKQGQTMTMDIGCELMLRIGGGTVKANSAVGLINMTDGNTLENGQALVTNHLYLVTLDGRGFTASSDAKLLVRGGYTIS
jgi:hypothetical protein